jgi:hypothetical protein
LGRGHPIFIYHHSINLWKRHRVTENMKGLTQK